MHVHVHETLDCYKVHYHFFDVKTVSTDKDCVLIKLYDGREFTFNLSNCKLYICS